MAAFLSPSTLHAEPSLSAPWTEPSYQYRIPLETVSEVSGWQRIPLSGEKLTEMINATEKFKYDPHYIAYNHVKLVEVDAEGKPVESTDETGYYLIPTGGNLAEGLLQVKTKHRAPITVTPGRFHILDYRSSGGGNSPAAGYEPVHERGHPMRKTDFKTSYFPPLNPLGETAHEVLFIPDRDTMDVQISGPWVTKISEITVRRAEILLLAHLEQAGAKRWFLYYQPIGSHHLQIPAKRRQEIPDAELMLTGIGHAQHHAPGLRYSLASDERVDVAFADSTTKLIPDLPLPEESRREISLYSAANESISFQIFITPKARGAFQSVTMSDLSMGNSKVPASGIRIKNIAYVPIRKSSFITPARYLGKIGDPLLPVEPAKLNPDEGPYGLWVTVKVPAGTSPGVYQGRLSLDVNGKDFELPVSLEVMDFELAEFSPLQTNMGGQYIAKVINYKGVKAKTIADYHGVSTPNDLRKLADAYFEVMADNKFNPKIPTLLTEIGMNWTPPPFGYNVDKPGNFFTLKDWDFTKFNQQLHHFIDEKKVNAICIYHTNPTDSNIFRQLPGKRLEGIYPTPAHNTMAWQTFRETTNVAYGEIPENQKDSIVQVSERQWDHLVLEYFRTLAKNLDENGWLDKAFILIDERPNPDQLEHFLRLLKSNPLTAKIKTVACIQATGEITEAAPGGNPGSRFRDILDTFAPEMNECYNRWEDYYRDDYGLSHDRKKLWFYLVTTARHAIDAPGINNRVIGMDIFRRNGSGILYWESFHWDNPYGDANTPEIKPPGSNPWIDPYIRAANGGLAYFYPPVRGDVMPKSPTFAITPSLRMEAFRQANTDFEYASILEKLMNKAKSQGIDVRKAEELFEQIRAFFPTNTTWSQNAWWYLDIRRRMAEEIVSLKSQVKAAF